MRGAATRHAFSAGTCESLAVRGGLARTFGSLVAFLIVIFLCGGLYILEDAFANPIAAGTAAVISAAFIITLAAVLLFFLIKPRKFTRMEFLEDPADSPTPKMQPSLEPVAGATRQHNSRNNLAYQRFYVDHSRIRP